jgi:hypothetical protein
LTARGTRELASRISRSGSMPSTVIQSYQYDAGQRELLVVFRSGRRYVYEDVSLESYQAMRRSFSKGEYFNAHIRDRHPFRRLDP